MNGDSLGGEAAVPHHPLQLPQLRDRRRVLLLGQVDSRLGSIPLQQQVLHRSQALPWGTLRPKPQTDRQ